MKIKPTFNDRLLWEIERCLPHKKASEKLVSMFHDIIVDKIKGTKYAEFEDQDGMIKYAMEYLLKSWSRFKIGLREPDSYFNICAYAAFVYFVNRKRSDPTWRT